MGLLDWLRGSEPPRDPDALREHLLEATAAGDRARVLAVCRARREELLAAFPAWARIPPELRSDEAATRRYAEGLIGVATALAELGSPEAFARLTAGSDPLAGWRAALAQARALRAELRLDEATALLCDALIDHRELRGTAVDELTAMTLGSLGDLRFQGGDAAGALDPTRRALASSVAAGDAEGVRAYLSNLYELHRWLGQAAEAAAHAERLAERLEQAAHPDGEWFRTQARIVRAGEPRNRVIARLDDGRRREIADAPRLSAGRLRFEFHRDRLSLHPALVWTQRGEAHGARGAHADALDAFGEAARADPHDPHPHYQAGVTLLHLGRPSDALERYDAAEERAPGWFCVRADRWLAERLASGALPGDAFALLRRVEDGALGPEEAAATARRALEVAPGLGRAHLALARALRALAQPREAELALRAGLAAPDTDEDVRTRLLVEVATTTADAGERRARLDEAIALDGNLVAVAMARLLT